ncbi:hypothetical protein JCM8202_004952 [Rhodotorula sphaerocarpa]
MGIIEPPIIIICGPVNPPIPVPVPEPPKPVPPLGPGGEGTPSPEPPGPEGPIGPSRTPSPALPSVGHGGPASHPRLGDDPVKIGGARIAFLVQGVAQNVECLYDATKKVTLYPVHVRFEDDTTSDIVVCGCFFRHLLGNNSSLPPVTNHNNGTREYQGPFSGKLLGVQIGYALTANNFTRLYFRCPYPGQPCDLFRWLSDSDPDIVRRLTPFFRDGTFCATVDGDWSSSLRQLVVERDSSASRYLPIEYAHTIEQDSLVEKLFRLATGHPVTDAENVPVDVLRNAYPAAHSLALGLKKLLASKLDPIPGVSRRRGGPRKPADRPPTASDKFAGIGQRLDGEPAADDRDGNLELDAPAVAGGDPSNAAHPVGFEKKPKEVERDTRFQELAGHIRSISDLLAWATKLSPLLPQSQAGLETVALAEYKRGQNPVYFVIPTAADDLASLHRLHIDTSTAVGKNGLYNVVWALYVADEDLDAAKLEAARRWHDATRGLVKPERGGTEKAAAVVKEAHARLAQLRLAQEIVEDSIALENEILATAAVSMGVEVERESRVAADLAVMAAMPGPPSRTLELLLLRTRRPLQLRA